MSFRKSSDDFISNNSRLKVVDNPAAVIFQVFSWTNGERHLTDLMFKLILKHNFHIHNGEEEKRVNQFVQFYLVTEWESNEASDHLNKIRNWLLQHQHKEKVLLKLHEILRTKVSSKDESSAARALLTSTLVIEKEGRLQVHNRIYQSVFNQTWAKKELEAANIQVQAGKNRPNKNRQAALSFQSNMSQALFHWKLGFLYPAIAGILVLAVVLFVWQQWPDKAVRADSSDERVNDSLTQAASAPAPNQPSTLTLDPIEQNISGGEKMLIENEELGQQNIEFRAAKNKGVEAIADGNYRRAVQHFEKAIAHYSNAPETLIYLNNARSEVSSPGQSYTIAAAVPMSVDLSAAQAMLRGVAQAQQGINEKGGINGVPLKVVIVDDGGNADIAPSIATTLGRKSEILGVVGHYYSSVTISAAESYKAENLPIIALSTSVEISRLGNDHIFRTSPSDAITGKALANHMLDVWEKGRVAVFYNANSSYSSSLAGEFTSTVLSEGGAVVSEFDWSQEIFDPQQAYAQALAQNAQVLMLIPSEFKELTEHGFPVAQLNFQNQNPLKLMGGDVVYSDKVLRQDFADMVVGTFWHIDAANPTSEFVIQSKQLWKAEVNWVTAMAYDATQAWIEALELSNGQATRNALQKILSSSDGFFAASGVSDPIHFNSSGDRLIPVQLVKVQQDSHSTKVHYRFRPVPTSP